MTENIFGITAEKAAKSVKDIAILMECDYRTVWEQYTHEIVKMAVKWEDIEPFLKD